MLQPGDIVRGGVYTASANSLSMSSQCRLQSGPTYHYKSFISLFQIPKHPEVINVEYNFLVADTAIMAILKETHDSTLI